MSEQNGTSGLPLFNQKPARKRSPTSVDAGRASSEARGKRREHVYLAIASSGDSGLARFQVAEVLGVSDHWITSSVEALIVAKRIKEHDGRTVINPRSGKRCAVLVVRRDT